MCPIVFLFSFQLPVEAKSLYKFVISYSEDPNYQISNTKKCAPIFLDFRGKCKFRAYWEHFSHLLLIPSIALIFGAAKDSG